MDTRTTAAPTSGPAPSLTEQLFARDAQAAESPARRGGPRLSRGAEQTRPGPHRRPILEAIETEQRDLAECDDKIRPRPAGHPRQVSRTTPDGAEDHCRRRCARSGERRRVASMRSTEIPRRWLTGSSKITTIPGDVGSRPRTWRWQHWDGSSRRSSIARVGCSRSPTIWRPRHRPSRCSARDSLATGCPWNCRRGSGPLPESLETPKARGAYRAETTVRHED